MGGKAKFGAPPLMTWVTGKKSFKDSLRTSGSPIEQAINKGVLKAAGQDEKKKSSNNNDKKDNVGNEGDPMMKYLNKMQKEQKAQIAQAAEAQKQALLQSQMAAGAQAEQMGENSAQQQLATMGSIQSIRDANAKLAAQQAQAVAGQQATGGGFDFNRSREEALANLGAASGMLPTTPTKIPTTNIVNPALSGLINQGKTAPKKANMFSLPSSSDLKFGGV